MPRPLRAEIHIDALRANLSQVRGFTPGARIWSVVKALGYGHGLEAVVAGFAAADGIALVEFDAAERVRQMGYAGPVLMLEGPFEMRDVEVATQRDLQLVIHCREHLDWLEHQAVGCSVWIKIDTGMHRLGFDPADVPAVIERIQVMKSKGRVAQAGLMTHFANADVPGGVLAPLQRWESLMSGLPAACASWPVSLSNSAAVIDRLV
ncbi:MAG: alanine racemase, partial [Burkholderiaceae bacterium]